MTNNTRKYIKKDKYIKPHLITGNIQSRYKYIEIDENCSVNILHHQSNCKKAENIYLQIRTDNKLQIHKYSNSFIWLLEMENLNKLLITSFVDEIYNLWALDYYGNILDTETLYSLIV